MIQNEAIFYNWSDEDFEWKLDGKAYLFKAGSMTPMTEVEFKHFSKHLTDREMGKANLQTNDLVEREKFLAKCTGALDVASTPNIQVPTVQAEARFCEHCLSKGVRHMKDCTRPVDKPEEKPFADVNAPITDKNAS